MKQGLETFAANKQKRCFLCGGFGKIYGPVNATGRNEWVKKCNCNKGDEK